MCGIFVYPLLALFGLPFTHNSTAPSLIHLMALTNYQDHRKLSVVNGPVLRDTARLSRRYPPSLRAVGFLVSQHGQLGAIPPPPFLSVSPLESMRSGGAIPPPPPQKGYLSSTCAMPYESKANGRDTPLCDTILKGYCAIWGWRCISHWAAKLGS